MKNDIELTEEQEEDLDNAWAAIEAIGGFGDATSSSIDDDQPSNTDRLPKRS